MQDKAAPKLAMAGAPKPAAPKAEAPKPGAQKADAGPEPAPDSIEGRLKEARHLARLSEIRDLDIKKYEYEQYTQKENDLEGLKEKFSVRRIAIGGGAIAAVVVVVSLAVFIYRATIPGRLLSGYEEALESNNFTLADSEISKYFNYVPDDWERMVEHGHLLLRNGQFVNARNTYARLLAKSPLSSDKDILFLSGVSHMPKTRTAQSKMSEILVSFDDYIPALMARAILNASDLEQSKADIDLAVTEIASLRADGETFTRYQGLYNLFMVSLCKSEGAFKGTTAPTFEVYPADLKGNELLLYGLDPNISLNLCTTVPREVDQFTPNLEAMALAIKSLVAVRLEERDEAIQTISQSAAKETFPLNAYLNGILLAESGEMLLGETAFLRTGLETPEILIALNIVKVLQGPDKWDEKAREPLDKLVKSNNTYAQAFNNLGVLSMLEGRYGQAKNDLEVALRTQKHNAYAIYNLGLVNMLTGDPSRAIELFNSLASIGDSDADFPGLSYYLALASRNLGEEDRAINLLRKSVDVPGYGPLANLALGDIYAGEIIGAEEALKFYEKAYELDPNNYEAGVKLALMNSKLGRPDFALREIDRIESGYTPRDETDKRYFEELLITARGEIQFDTGSPEAMDTLKRAFDEVKDLTLYKRVVALYVDALIAAEEVREALDVTRTALPADPQDPSLLITRAKALAAFNDIEEAIEIILDAERIDPDNPVMLVTKARIMARDQRFEESVNAYRKLYETKPNDISPLLDALAMLERVGGYPELEADVKEQLDRAQYSPGQSLASSASEVSQIKDPAEVAKIEAEIDELAKLMESGTADRFGGHLYRGYLLTRIGKIPDSINEFLEATKHMEDNPEEAFKAWQNLANSYILTAQFEDARVALQNALELNPPTREMNTIFLTLAGVKERLGLLEEALEDYGMIIEAVPNFTLPYLRRAAIYLNNNEPGKAVEDLSYIIRLEPENLEAYRARNKAYNMLGDNENAAKDSKSITLLENRLQDDQ